MNRPLTAMRLCAAFVGTFAGAIGLLASSATAQLSQPELTLTFAFNQVELDITVDVVGTPDTTVALAICTNHLAYEPASTPWGDLFVNPNQATVLYLALDNDGHHALSFSIPVASPLVLGFQALGSDHAGDPTLLSAPAALAATAGGNSLSYFRGTWKAECTAKLSPERMEIRINKKVVAVVVC